MIDPATLPAFSDMASRIRLHAMQAPDRPALIEGARRLDYAALDRQMDRIAAASPSSGEHQERAQTFAGRKQAVTHCVGQRARAPVVFGSSLRRAGVR